MKKSDIHHHHRAQGHPISDGDTSPIETGCHTRSAGELQTATRPRQQTYFHRGEIMKKLVQIPTTNVWVNPIHVVYVEQKPPFDGGDDKEQQRVEVCFTMYGRYRTENVFNKTAAEVAAIINGDKS
jgi:hypothetical protein